MILITGTYHVEYIPDGLHRKEMVAPVFIREWFAGSLTAAKAAVAGSVAQYMAISSFPLGAGLGGAWYGLFPASPSLALVIGSTGGIIALASCVAALSGVVTDPVQKSLGIHERRLHSMLDRLEPAFLGKGRGTLKVREHYIARLVDLLDIARTALR